MKICFATDVHYPNYTKRIQESALKCFLNIELYNYDIHYYISTNRPRDLEHHNGKNNIKIFDIEFLRDNNIPSKQHEILPKNPVGTYPSTYPYNLRRFIIEKAAMDGFDYIIYVDADLMFNNGIDGKTFKDSLVSKYEPNKLKSNVSIYHYSKDSTSEIFALHDQYLNNLNYDFSNKKLDTVDGPVMVFMGNTNQDILRLCKVWDYITIFGYEKKLGFGYDNFFIANLSFVIPMSDFILESEEFPFYPNHIFEDRYDHSYVASENEFDYDEKINLSSNSVNNDYNLNDIGLEFGTDKATTHNYLRIYEKYFKEIRDNSLNIMEIGVDTGASLKLWEKYFRHSKIYGVDINDKKQYETDRIKIIISNQENESDLESLPVGMDIIIDDGGHTMIQQQNSLKKLFNTHLKNGGIYIIEDLQTSTKDFGDACSYHWGSTEKNNTLKLLYDLKNKNLSNDSDYYLTNNDFYNILNSIENIEIYDISWGSKTCIIKKKNNIKNEKKLIQILEGYSSPKSKNEFSFLFEGFLDKITNENPNILEIGVGTLNTNPLPNETHVPANMVYWKKLNPNYIQGSSLRAIRDYLNTGIIYGIDNQKDCEINENRITTKIFDSRSKKLSEEFLENKKFDLIIDDGDLDVNIRIINFNNYYNSLKEDGYYVIQGILKTEFLKNYFEEINVPYILTDSYMILNKKNNFDLINKLQKNEINQNNLSDKITDYSDKIKKSLKFSIDGNVLADIGFYINLDTSLERNVNVHRLKNTFKIDGLLRFEALRDEMIQFACTKSHLSIFENCKKNNIESVFVAEDDFHIDEFLYNPKNEKINFFDKIKEIKNDLDLVEWDVFLFGCNPKTHLVPITNNLAVIDNSTGAWAYIIKRRAYEYLLQNLHYKRDYIAIDDYLPLLNSKGFKTITSIPMTIGHAVGYVSTLQPRGPVDYTEWIRGAYQKFLYDSYPNNNYIEDRIEKNITVVIPGYFCENYLMYLRYCLKSLPKELRKCKFLIRYDIPTENHDLTEFIKLQAYFRDVRSDLNVTLTYGFGGLVASWDYFYKTIRTPYFIMLEHDYVFLDKNRIDFGSIIRAFNNNNFVHSIFFSGDDISVRGFDLCTDKFGNTSKFEKEHRVFECDLVKTCRWSNRPGIHRTSKIVELYNKYIKHENIGKIRIPIHDTEDRFIYEYNKMVSENSWDDVKDYWGTYLYGKMGDEPLIAHTDATKRYQDISIKSILEYNGEKYINENKLTEND